MFLAIPFSFQPILFHVVHLSTPQSRGACNYQNTIVFKLYTFVRMSYV